MTHPVRVLGLAGSLRQASYNRALLRAAVELAPPEVALSVADIGAIPLYNEDVYEQGFPEPVIALREAIRRAEAVLIVTPEYNYSVPGVLKNAIDWVSRPPEQPFDGKPVAIMGASPGMFGSARAQYHLRQTLVSLNARPMSKPEVMVASAHQKFDAHGKLADETTARFVTAQLEALAAWARRVGDEKNNG
ncbi:chromate reductase [Crenobacter luteus]|uniref:NADPH-dependent FMN reductase n=1 Tax=Crenobacter luteus TaxID=1452487 RepID=UPI00104A423C|nr:NADPH-dependent FMN reductase [Crenobacter luteus]TCP14894.1 chromate reductase [Crenobacter luteus]